MRIAITAHSEDINSLIFQEFATTPFVLIVNVDTMACTPIAHTPAPGSDEQLARTIVEHDCEAVITGTLAEAAFAMLAKNHVTRYAAGNMTAAYALDAMERRELQLIRNPQGTDECHGTPPELDDLRVCSGHHH
ncbi:NifB/NifX family molybdenum-iron cluster-binding protein [Desulfovibrionales bacterium]